MIMSFDPRQWECTCGRRRFFAILRLLVSGYVDCFGALFVLPHAGLAVHIQPVPKEDKKGLLGEVT